MTPLSVRRRWLPLTLFAVALVLLSTAIPGTALADPDEGDLDSTLEKAISDYIEAEEELKAAEKREKTVEKQIKKNKTKVTELSAQVEQIAAAAYAGGNLSSVTAVLGAESLDLAIDRAMIVNYLGDESAKTVNRLVETREELAAEEELLKEEIENQTKALGKMEDARNAAADQLAGSGGNNAQGPSTDNARVPDPAPRNPDGSYPDEGCSVNDSTTDSCISPRLKHARDQATIAGFQRYVSCFRGGGGGDHPLGKACDFSAAPGGFKSEDAGGGDKEYGDSLAGWFVKHADRLGVKYVIWYRQIWERGFGWGPYSGGGDPASAHTNHVHLSMI
ncbi:hypothetical protein AB0I28_19085 [Phytomonospora sp. NPDC050363]|uniref:coiled-coil domain-containing protein n=1 Tax=Phytomonospora sp. NPDC050363 TaxID=3155642 RepID=UPI0033F36CD0